MNRIQKQLRQMECKLSCVRSMLLTGAAVLLTLVPETALAEGGDPIAVVNNFSDFLFALVKAFGMILIGFGIVQVGLSLKSHDPSQRANGIMTVAGGIVITFAKEILNLIAG